MNQITHDRSRRMNTRRIVALLLVVALAAPSPAVAAQTQLSGRDQALVTGVVVGVLVGIIAWAATYRPRSSEKKIRAAMDPWVGKDINALIGEWGAPSGVFQMPDGRATIYTWLYQGGTLVTGTGGALVAQTATSDYCRFDWTANTAARIAAYRWEGACLLRNRQGSQ